MFLSFVFFLESNTTKKSGAGETSGGEARIGQLKRRTNPETWKANIQKRRRMKGLSYLGRRHNEEVSKEAKKIGGPCQSAVCMKSKKLHCEEIHETDRESIFKSFWESLDWRERKVYVASLVDVAPVKRRGLEQNILGRPHQFSVISLWIIKGSGCGRACSFQH